MVASNMASLMSFHVHQGYFHLQGSVSQKPQQLSFCGNLGRHEIDNGNLQGTNILLSSTLLCHDKYIFLFQHRTGWQVGLYLNRHSSLSIA